MKSLAVTALFLYVASVTLFGKGPTYLGVPPIYWGELVLLASILWASPRWKRALLQDAAARTLTLCVGAFLVLGAIELLRNFSNISIDALRDSATCYYSLFFFVGVVLAADRRRFDLFASQWKWCWILVIPLHVLQLFFGNPISDNTSGSPLGFLISIGGGEVVQGVGLGCILLIIEKRTARVLGPLLRTALIFIGLVTLALDTGRGVRVAVAGAFLVAIMAQLRQPRKETVALRRFKVLAIVALAGIVGAAIAGIDVGKVSNLDRFAEIADTATGDNVAGGTASWRADWWRGIWDVVLEKDPFFGLGFGDPLWEYNPSIQEAAERPLRAPHNYNVTVFARMGFAGVFLWSCILLLGLFQPVWRVISATTLMEQAESRHLTFWLACLAALWLNASFGVLMEGPVAGIPFWLIMGFVAQRGRTHTQRFRFVATVAANTDSHGELSPDHASPAIQSAGR